MCINCWMSGKQCRPRSIWSGSTLLFSGMSFQIFTVYMVPKHSITEHWKPHSENAGTAWFESSPSAQVFRTYLWPIGLIWLKWRFRLVKQVVIMNRLTKVIFPKCWDTLTPYHTCVKIAYHICSKISTSLYYHLLMSPKTAGRLTNSEVNI